MKNSRYVGVDEGGQLSSSLTIIYTIDATKMLLKLLHNLSLHTHHVIKKGWTKKADEDFSLCLLRWRKKPSPDISTLRVWNSVTPPVSPKLGEHEPLSSTNHGTLSAISSGLLVDTNLDTSAPNTYQAPPAPLPYDLGLASSQTLARAVDSCGSKNDHIQLANSQTTGETNDTLKTSDCKNKTDCEQNSRRITEDEVSKPIISPTEEDVCPICLEDYDVQNPRVMTNVNTISICLVFLNGWREVIPVRSVIKIYYFNLYLQVQFHLFLCSIGILHLYLCL
ncbi:unnamed protein product [Musa acuminata subsp. malaccensis]|uniref:RING-type E3 ubiquitin transferase n=1 Tax=Musa acuminata subsp. malaccensis TaxID=214687 RepID=A0A804KLR8_MUSAM|nr:unnamed protein product [Musa acuminata subsp. malaccensis]